jgi:hypothetical protein
MAVTMKNAVFWDVALCGSCLNRRFGGTCRLHLQGGKNQLVTALATRSSESSLIRRPTRRHIPEDGILPSHRHEYLRFYVLLKSAAKEEVSAAA